jgi:hypothetical protein
LRPGRFAGYEAASESAVVTTTPVKLTGDDLLVNVAAPKGPLKVELLYEDGQMIRGYSGEAVVQFSQLDEIRQEIRWKEISNLTALRGHLVRLRFTFRDAKVYAFAFR